MDTNANSLRGEQDRLSMIERQLEALKQGGSDVIIMPRPARRPASRRRRRRNRGVSALQRDARGGARHLYRETP